MKKYRLKSEPFFEVYVEHCLQCRKPLIEVEKRSKYVTVVVNLSVFPKRCHLNPLTKEDVYNIFERYSFNHKDAFSVSSTYSYALYIRLEDLELVVDDLFEVVQKHIQETY